MQKGSLKNAFQKAVSRKAPWHIRILRCALLSTTGVVAFQAGLTQLPGRAETPGERAMLTPIFKNAISYDKVRVNSSSAVDRIFNPLGGRVSGSITAGHTHGNVIVITPLFKSADFSKLPVYDERRETFIHENVHIWQIQNRPIKTILDMLGNIPDKLRGINQTYDYTLKPGKDLLDYSLEQQATIITDYYVDLQHGLPPEYSRNKETGPALRALYDSTLKNFKANPNYIAGHGL